MAEQHFWQRMMIAVERIYERRIRSASLIGEYGAVKHSNTTDSDEGEAAVIANVPRGTRLAARADNEHTAR